MRCPTCATELGDRSICYRCGSLPALETRIRTSKFALQGLLHSVSNLLPRRFEGAHFLWACAIIPLLMLPPLFSLVYSIRAMRQRTGQLVQADFEWIAIVSAVNVIVSALVLYKLNVTFHEIWAQGPDLVRSLLRRWLELFSPRPPSYVPKLTPV